MIMLVLGYGIAIITLWYSKSIIMIYYGIAMVVLGYCYGIAMVMLLW